MFLSKLRMQGFKSFSEKTVLDFSKGITSIVGPNGCGKTNIVDAIRWVLGEQKSSVLRSNKMEDVIFNGTQRIKPLGFCEVEITIENNRGLLPLEYNTVEICRRYYRSGESEYYINKTLCRLKDVHEMFIDTGMSSGAYSVIELKMIESILSQNPTDRRVMFDEASGINNYNKQRNASSRRLVNTKSDMERISDIMSEVETNVKNLKLQMKRYDRHAFLSSDLINAEYLFHKKNLNAIIEEIIPLKEKLSSGTKIKNTFNKELGKKEKLLEEIQKKFEETKIKMERNQSDIKVHEESIVTANQEIIVSTEQTEHSKNRIDHFKNEINDKKRLFSTVNKEIGSMKKDHAQIEPKMQKKDNEYRRLEDKLLKLNEQMDSFEKDDGDKKNRLNENINKIVSMKNSLEINKKLILEKKSSISRIKENINNNMIKDSENSGKLKEILLGLDKANTKKGKMLKDVNKLNASLKRITEKTSALLNKKYENELNLKQNESKLDFYNKIIISKQGSCDGNEYIVENINKHKNIVGKVSDLISVPKHLITAVSMCLGEFSDFLVVENFSNAKKIISSIPKGMSLNLIVLDGITNKKFDKTTTSHILHHLKCDKKVTPLFNYLLSEFIVVDNLKDIKKISGSYVTLDGDILNSMGVYQLKPNKNESTMFIKSELSKIKDSIAAYKKKIKSCDNDIKLLNKSRNRLNSDLLSLNKSLEGRTKYINELLVTLEHNKFISKEIQEQNRSSRTAIDKIEKEIISMEIQNKEYNLEIKLANKKTSSMKKNIDSLRQKIHDKRNVVIELRQNMQSKNIELVEYKNKATGLRNRINDYETNLKNINEDLQRYNQEIIKLEDLVKKLKVSVINTKKTITELYKIQKKLNLEDQKLQNKYTNEYKLFQEYQSEIKDKRLLKDDNIEGVNKLELIISQLNAKSEYHQEFLNEIDLDELKEDSLEKFKKLSIEEVNLKVDSIKRSIDRIGPVNMEVNSQHKAEIERFDFLNGQYSDLVDAKKSLEETIRKLDSEAKRMFLDTFKKINENFKKTYNMFYKNGKAELDLKGDDVLQSEIVIKATPPGKSSQHLRMLSGGEKAITAIALLFAIYLVKPSPFCILDEVDAPLDDINIGKFNDVLKQFSKKTQFIIVTHNKLTMERSNYLYGVTQHQKGVSKVVSVNLLDLDKENIH